MGRRVTGVVDTVGPTVGVLWFPVVTPRVTEGSGVERGRTVENFLTGPELGL